MRYKYRITKRFIDGILKGLTVTENTNVSFQLGKIYGEYEVIGIYYYA